MASAPSSPTQTRKRSIVVTDTPKFDLESYIQNYKGRTRLERLVLIGTSSTFLGVDALKAAVIEAKQGQDVKKYVETVGHLQIIGPTEKEAVIDNAWVEKQNKHNAAETNRLEHELKGYKNNLIKESIRMGNEDLGKHYQAIGDLAKAFEAYSRMRQDISISKHIVDVSKHLIEVAIEQRNWLAVSTNVQKIRGNNPVSMEEDKSLQPYLCAADGLAQMDSGEYYSAAHSFLATNSGLAPGQCSEIISQNDIAIYGGLCALASMDRNELQRKVLDNSNFRSYLELEPHIRRAITFFVNSRYAQCLAILESYRADYLLDLHLQKHVDELYHLIRSKSIVQYFIPFSCVTLDNLNAQFAAPGKSIEKELVQMIARKELDARIDTQNRVVTAVPSDARARLQASTLAVAREYERELRRRILHMNIAEADLEVKNPKKHALATFGGADDWEDSMGAGRALRSFHG
ncbi:COP9 signalosome-like protein complex subunit 1 [Coleophoma crateriformis]|uniref:COP9 signalosome complex subunit 1 n=1 Tax=Coleophoma crateriformis TaxID=565419 RepID=A0A3D8SA62_9HELO|nr:COP9 signalosome-like protein complex subunit 1 [Coleophoma crateriformis]